MFEGFIMEDLLPLNYDSTILKYWSHYNGKNCRCFHVYSHALSLLSSTNNIFMGSLCEWNAEHVLIWCKICKFCKSQCHSKPISPLKKIYTYIHLNTWFQLCGFHFIKLNSVIFRSYFTEDYFVNLIFCNSV